MWFFTGSSYTGSGWYAAIVFGTLSNVSNCFLSLANNAIFLCCVHLSQERGGVMIGLIESVDMKRSLARINCWLLHVVLKDCVTSQLSYTCVSICLLGP